MTITNDVDENSTVSAESDSGGRERRQGKELGQRKGTEGERERKVVGEKRRRGKRTGGEKKDKSS